MFWWDTGVFHQTFGVDEHRLIFVVYSSSVNA